MRRAATERYRTLHTWRRHLATHGANILCNCELQPGRFRKSQRVGGCGRSQCYLCHFSKLTGQPKVRDLRSLASELEGLVEIEAANNAIESTLSDRRYAFRMVRVTSRVGSREEYAATDETLFAAPMQTGEQ